MTCQAPINPDRAQLMAIAAADATIRSPRSAMAHLLDNPAPASGHAATTAPQPSNGTRTAMIERRASRLRFPNEIQRQRYIRRHSQPCSGDA